MPMILAFLAPRIFSMSNLSADIRKVLLFDDLPAVVLAVGNTLRSDDGVAAYIAVQLAVRPGLMVIDAGYSPENFIDQIVNFHPKRILIVDAADFQGRPGEIRLIDSADIPSTSLSTHSIPLSVVAAILSADSGAVINFLGIQPMSLAMGEGLSLPVKEAADEIIHCIQTGGAHA